MSFKTLLGPSDAQGRQRFYRRAEDLTQETFIAALLLQGWLRNADLLLPDTSTRPTNTF